LNHRVGSPGLLLMIAIWRERSNPRTGYLPPAQVLIGQTIPKEGQGFSARSAVIIAGSRL
jgi:hypothetical protein